MSAVQLKVMLPQGIFLDREVTKVVAEAENGSFCLLPRHIDFVAALVPGLLAFEDMEGNEEFLAVNHGVLVKKGPEVIVSTTDAVLGPDLGKLRQTITEQYATLDERERHARSALARLESEFVRRFIELRS